MIQTQHFKKTVTAQGRNGNIKMTGVQVFNSSSETVFISPLTSQKKVANCWIEVPKEELQDFITLLQQYL